MQDYSSLALLLPLIQIDASPSGFTWSVDREEGLNTFAFPADGEGVKKIWASLPVLLPGLALQGYSSTIDPALWPSARGIVAGQLDRANARDRRGTGASLGGLILTAAMS